MKPVRFRVHCALAECYYYLKEEGNPLTGEANLIFCTYPERDLTDDARPCPYYRMDWQKKMKLVQEKINANKAAKLKAQSQSQSHLQPAAISETELDSANKPESQPPITPPDVLFEQDNKFNPQIGNSTLQDEKPQEEQKTNSTISSPQPK